MGVTNAFCHSNRRALQSNHPVYRGHQYTSCTRALRSSIGVLTSVSGVDDRKWSSGLETEARVQRLTNRMRARTADANSNRSFQRIVILSAMGAAVPD